MDFCCVAVVVEIISYPNCIHKGCLFCLGREMCEDKLGGERDIAYIDSTRCVLYSSNLKGATWVLPFRSQCVDCSTISANTPRALNGRTTTHNTNKRLLVLFSDYIAVHFTHRGSHTHRKKVCTPL